MPGVLYAILRHEGIDQPHYDLMVQTAPGSSALATWRADVWPVEQPLVLQRIADHRAAYLTFEGEIAGGRGHVRRVEQGICQLEISKSLWKIEMTPLPSGLKRILRLEKISGDQWRCTVVA